jgi:hypothetical protein
MALTAPGRRRALPPLWSARRPQLRTAIPASLILVWLVRLLPQASGLVLRTASLLLIFLAVATIPLNNPVLFAVPVLPALFLIAMAPPVILVRWIGNWAEAPPSRHSRKRF